MALQEFKITYRDGSAQTVTAARHRTEGEWIVFYAAGNHQALRIPDGDVQSIAQAGVPDRETPSPMIA